MSKVVRYALRLLLLVTVVGLVHTMLPTAATHPSPYVSALERIVVTPAMAQSCMDKRCKTLSGGICEPNTGTYCTIGSGHCVNESCV